MARFLGVEEIGARIARKREEAGIARSALANALGTTVTEVERLERGEVDPLPGDWVLLAARALRIDYLYFVTTDLDNDQDTARRVYRALDNPTPQDEFDLRRFFFFACDEYDIRSMLSRPLPNPPPTYASPRRVDNRRHAWETAKKERARLSLGLSPVENPFELLRRQGVTLFRQRLRDSALSGITIMHPRIGPCVLINYDDDLYRQFFSAMHEYAHILFDREKATAEQCIVSYTGKGRTRDPVEVRANAFASAFLLPREALKGAPRANSEPEMRKFIRDLAEQYKINTEVVVYALKDVGIFNQEQVDYWKDNRPKIAPSQKHDPDIPHSLTERQRERRQAAIEHGLDTRYLQMVRDGLVENAISMGRAAEALDVPMAHVREFLAEVGVAL